MGRVALLVIGALLSGTVQWWGRLVPYTIARLGDLVCVLNWSEMRADPPADDAALHVRLREACVFLVQAVRRNGLAVLARTSLLLGLMWASMASTDVEDGAVLLTFVVLSLVVWFAQRCWDRGWWWPFVVLGAWALLGRHIVRPLARTAGGGLDWLINDFLVRVPGSSPALRWAVFLTVVLAAALVVGWLLGSVLDNLLFWTAAFMMVTMFRGANDLRDAPVEFRAEWSQGGSTRRSLVVRICLAVLGISAVLVWYLIWGRERQQLPADASMLDTMLALSLLVWLLGGWAAEAILLGVFIVGRLRGSDTRTLQRYLRDRDQRRAVWRRRLRGRKPVLSMESG